MVREHARLRERNQVTLPSSLVERLGLHVNDLVEFTMTDEGQVQLHPAKIVKAGTPDAWREEQAAKEDIRQGRYSAIESLDDFRKHVEKVRKGERPSDKTKSALTESQRKDVEAVVARTLMNLLSNLVDTRSTMHSHEKGAVERESIR